jgi:hypothetical protein
LERLLHSLVVNYHLTRFETQLIAIGCYLLVVLAVVAVILAIRKAVSGSRRPQPATGAQVCAACGAASSGVRFCPECGHQMS